MRYLITSRPGMTPWDHCSTLAEAKASSHSARMQGLDGHIIDTQTARQHEREEERARRQREENDITGD